MMMMMTMRMMMMMRIRILMKRIIVKTMIMKQITEGG